MEPISIEDNLKVYDKFLQNNNRSLFSARFGDGKSYFLNTFKKKYDENYLFITIYPVNYQIVDNKDILELIKRDILIQLITSGHLVLSDEDYGDLELSYAFIQDDKTDLFFDLLSSFVALGYPLAKDVLKKIKGYRESFIKHKKEYDPDRSKAIDEFINAQNKHIYEFDPISEIIHKTIIKAKEEEKHKKVVLLIEDLDRIDPKHIFRVMNIFSAHFERNCNSPSEWETTNGGNKFGFDNLVLVCHYENIRNIFHHFYGTNTDFVGYISKFSPSKPFTYSLRVYMEGYIITNMPVELKDHHPIYKCFAQFIVEKDKDNMNGESLRRIVDNICSYKPLIKDGTITVGAVVINKKTPFSIFLDMLNQLGIEFSEFNRKAAASTKNYNECLARLIGVCWLASGAFMVYGEDLCVRCGNDQIGEAVMCFEFEDQKVIKVANMPYFNFFDSQTITDLVDKIRKECLINYY